MDEIKGLEVSMASLSPLLEEVLSAGGHVELTVTGNSMRPLLRHRVSIVRLSPARELKTGDVPLYRRDNGAFVLHRIVKRNGTLFTMCGDNQYHVERGIRRDQVLAVMTGFSRDGKTWRSCGGLGYRMYSRIWIWLRPLRHLWFGGLGRLRAFLKK